MIKENHTHFLELRKNNPIFTYENFDFSIINECNIAIVFHFSIGENIHFYPKTVLNTGKYAAFPYDQATLQGLIFHIGMIELISYWKAACPPVVHIKEYSLSNQQQQWWKKLYWKGLGEFFYQNGIQSNYENFLHFSFDEKATPISSFSYQQISESDRVIVPIGGGKDSVVTLEALRKEKQVIPFIINPRGATLDCACIAGFPEKEDIVIMNRTIDPLLLELNNQGFLNGHTPFSAMLAFYSLLAASVTNTREIALSNESSANEPTIPGTEINHQYSKSYEFEKDFREYVKENMNNIAHYYSYLRQYNELEIAEMFARYPNYFPYFRSCNVGSKENKWCCNCPKCLFAFLILSPFMNEKTMLSIFGEDLLEKPSLLPYFDELTGIAENKPFECIGTLKEVNQAMMMIKEQYKHKLLIQHYLNYFGDGK